MNTVRGCVWGAATIVAGGYELVTDALCDAIEVTYQRHKDELIDSKGNVDYLSLAVYHKQENPPAQQRLFQEEGT